MLRGIWASLVLLLITPVLCVPVAILTPLLPRHLNLAMRAGKIWGRVMLWAVGARVTYHGLESVPADTPLIFIANHQSIVDVWVVPRICPLATRFVAKEELFRIPIFGWAMRIAGFIPIARSNRTDAIRSLRSAAERIRAGNSVVLFPEGTRSSDGRLRPFKKGAFHLALSAGVGVVPVAITGSFEILPPNGLRVRPGPVEVHIDPPVDVTPFLPSDYDGLRHHVQQMIGRHVEPPRVEPEDDSLAVGSR